VQGAGRGGRATLVDGAAHGASGVSSVGAAHDSDEVGEAARGAGGVSGVAQGTGGGGGVDRATRGACMKEDSVRETSTQSASRESRWGWGGVSKGEILLIKDNMTRDDDAVGEDVKASSGARG
jgi:hypothetical protein